MGCREALTFLGGEKHLINPLIGIETTPSMSPTIRSPGLTKMSPISTGLLSHPVAPKSFPVPRMHKPLEKTGNPTSSSRAPSLTPASMTRPPSRAASFPASVICHAVRWYFRFQLSSRDIEELLFECGVTVTYETIRCWCDKFGRGFAHRVKAARQGSSQTVFFKRVLRSSPATAKRQNVRQAL